MAKGSGSKGGAHGVGGAAGRTAGALALAAGARFLALNGPGVLREVAKGVASEARKVVTRRAASEAKAAAAKAATRAGKSAAKTAIVRASGGARDVAMSREARRSAASRANYFRDRIAGGTVGSGAKKPGGRSKGIKKTRALVGAVVAGKKTRSRKKKR